MPATVVTAKVNYHILAQRPLKKILCGKGFMFALCNVWQPLTIMDWLLHAVSPDWCQLLTSMSSAGTKTLRMVWQCFRWMISHAWPLCGAIPAWKHFWQTLALGDNVRLGSGTTLSSFFDLWSDSLFDLCSARLKGISSHPWSPAPSMSPGGKKIERHLAFLSASYQTETYFPLEWTGSAFSQTQQLRLDLVLWLISLNTR